ncbi:MAG: hypothetical protein CME06_16980 [Gemmatimonadetes bacterium]|nr:hypothetical protein [Gemmatimonadota bacterium]
MALESIPTLIAAAGDPLPILILVGCCFWCSDPREAATSAWPVGLLWAALVLTGGGEVIATPERWWVLAGSGAEESARLSSRVALSVAFFGALALRRGGWGGVRAIAAIVPVAVACCELLSAGPRPIGTGLAAGLPFALLTRAQLVESIGGAARPIPATIRIGFPAALAIVALVLGRQAGAFETVGVIAGGAIAGTIIVRWLGDRLPIPSGRYALFARVLIGTSTTLALRWWMVEALPPEPPALLLRGALLGLWAIGGVPFLARKPEFPSEGGAPPL